VQNFHYLTAEGSDAGKDFGRWQVADPCGVTLNELSEIVVTHSSASIGMIFGPKTDLTPSNLSHSASAGKVLLN